jgi:2'-5' RNA ligase
VTAAKRLFVSLDPPPPIAQTLVRLNPRLRDVRWVAADQLHLTLAFFGNVAPENEEKLREKLGAIRFAHFFLPLQDLGTFPPKGSPKILWLGIGRGHPHLFQLHKRIADAALAAGLEPDLRPWHPHFTLARCDRISRSALETFLRANARFDAGLVPFSGFHLKSSRLLPSGSTYATELSISAS